LGENHLIFLMTSDDLVDVIEITREAGDVDPNEIIMRFMERYTKTLTTEELEEWGR